MLSFVLACGPGDGPFCHEGDCRCEGQVCECVGTAPCDLDCGLNAPCDFTCSTPGGCSFFPGHGSTVTCQGTGDCSIAGSYDDLNITCTTTGRCDIRCGYDCNISCNPSACATRCLTGGNCNFDCPRFMQCDSTSAVCGDEMCPVEL